MLIETQSLVARPVKSKGQYYPIFMLWYAAIFQDSLESMAEAEKKIIN
jgi:hypothetical protein